MISVVVPAHNEASVIQRSLEALTAGAAPGELEVIVVCNGCRDATAEIARAFGEPVRVLETEIASKANALNLGDASANGFPRVYMDADVVMSFESVRLLATTLENGPAAAAAPRVETVFPKGAAWSVRAYYDFWMALPYVQEGMVAAGVYAVSREGRSRFGRFPDVIADDGYFRLLFAPHERVEVVSAISTVSAPGRIADLVKIKTRSRLGLFQLQANFPELFERHTKTTRYDQALFAIARRPSLYLSAIPYVLVTLYARYRAARQVKTLDRYVWERDNSSRGDPAPIGR